MGKTMKTEKNATSMSVMEMGKLLGLSKVEAYWLVKKGVFKTTTATGHIRVLVDSFENWYDNQLHYKKVNGDKPGIKWITTTMSVAECQALLGVCDETIYCLLRKKLFKSYTVDFATRIDTKDFYRWYKSQNHYKTVGDAKLTAEQTKNLLSMPEISKLLNIHRNNVYYLVGKGHFEVVVFEGKKYVTKQSFEKWYASQENYHSKKE